MTILREFAKLCAWKAFAMSDDRKFQDVAVVLVAAGAGVRAGAGLPKQFRLVAGRPLIARAIEALANGLPGSRIIPVIDPAAAEVYTRSIAGVSPRAAAALEPWVAGGASRQSSAHAGVEAAATNTSIKIVLIHDCARLFTTEVLLEECIANAHIHGGAIPALPITDTLKEVGADRSITGGVDREKLCTVQTPQGFALPIVLDAHRRAAAAAAPVFTDDAAVVTWAGYRVITFPGDPDNFKVTTAQDFGRAEARVLRDRADIRTGQGFDVHAFAPGDHVWLGGVRIAHDRSLAGHSDADVVIHALCDALYGALAEGDIGAHFPPSDPRWRGAASDAFLRHAAGRVHARDGAIAHVDMTIVCEAPRIGPHRDAMRRRLADIMGIAIERVAVKATTSEKLGFTGRGEGIAALATATIRLPLGADG